MKSSRYTEQDIRFYDKEKKVSGDFMIDETGDFQLTDPYESVRQDVNNRLQTLTGDWRSHARIGSDLEVLEGEPNTRATGERGVRQIHQTLFYDQRVLPTDTTVRAVPIGMDAIHFFVTIDTPEKELIVLEQGLKL